MTYIQLATLCCPYVHALFHQRYQRQQTGRSELVDLGTVVWFRPGKGSRGFFCLFKSFPGPTCTEALLTFIPLDHLSPFTSLKWKPHYSLCSMQQEDKWTKDPRLSRSTFTRQGVGWGAVTPGCKHGSGWPRYKMPNAGVERMSKVGIGFCPLLPSTTPTVLISI